MNERPEHPGGESVHELSLMRSVLDILKESAAEHGITRVTRLRLVVGKLSHANPAALEFCFSVMQDDTEFAFARGAALDIEHRDVKARCRRCGREFTATEEYLVRCPDCGHPAEVLGGDELYLDYYEGE